MWLFLGGMAVGVVTGVLLIALVSVNRDNDDE